VVHEDAAVLVVNKPAGLVVHPAAATGAVRCSTRAAHAPQLTNLPRAGIVVDSTRKQRLLVVAKSLEAQTSLVRQLRRARSSAVHHGRGRVARGKVGAIGRHPKTAHAHGGGGAAPFVTHTSAAPFQRDVIALPNSKRGARTRSRHSTSTAIRWSASVCGKNAPMLLAFLPRPCMPSACIHPVQSYGRRVASAAAGDMRALIAALEAQVST
jgi:hypothetical protein